MGEDKNGGWYYGLIKSYQPSKGYGFIACEESFQQYGRDVFLHQNQAVDILKNCANVKKDL